MKRLDVEKTRVAHIVVQPRLRTPSDEAVDKMAASLQEIGLLCPVGVRIVDEMEIDGQITCGVPILIYGATRLLAARKLGWEHIDTQIIEADEIDATLAEIDENLARHELTTEEKRDHLRRRKELWEARQIENGKSFSDLGRPGRGNTGFAAETAAATGLSKQRINQLLADPKPPTKVHNISSVRAAKIDSDVQDRAVKEVAEVLAEYIPSDLWDGLKANLYAAKAVGIANAFSNIAGQSIMDRRYGE